MNKLLASLATAAVLAVAPLTPASAGTLFTVDFEKTWDYGTDVNGYYGGTTASDGSSGPNLGVTFSHVTGLSNDALGPYYQKAVSQQGVAYANDVAYMNLAQGFSGVLGFSYASVADIAGAVLAYSGLNGTGDLLGSLDLLATGDYTQWVDTFLNFTGTAQSFVFTAGAANVVAFDDIRAIPEPGSLALALLSLAGIGFTARRKHS